MGCTILGLGQGSLWCALSISRISDLAPDNSPGVTLGTIRVKIIREYLVAHRPLLCHPEPNNWLSLSLIVTICPYGQLFILSATSVIDRLRSRYSILLNISVSCLISLGKVHVLTLLPARPSCHPTCTYYEMQGVHISLKLLKIFMEFLGILYNYFI